MKATRGKRYGQIRDGRVHWIFTADDLPEWNNDQVPAVEIPDGVTVEAGDVFDGTAFRKYEKPKADKRRDVDVSLAQQLSEDVTYKGRIFQADERSRAALASVAACVATGWVVPPDYFWRDKSNQNVPFTNVDVIALHALVVARNWQRYQQAFAAKDAIGA